MLSAHFHGQSRDRYPIDLPSSCHPSPSLTTFEFRSRPLLDLDSYGGNDPLGMFPLFLKRTTDVLSTRLAVVVLRLLYFGSFLFDGEWLMLRQFQGAHLPPHWPITE